VFLFLYGFYKGVLGTRLGSLESEKSGHLKIHIGYLTFSFKKITSVSYFNLGVLELRLGGLSPPSPPPWWRGWLICVVLYTDNRS